MKGMASAQGLKQCPPDGRYPFNIVEATPGFTATRVVAGQQRGGDSKISLSLEIAEGEHAGYQAYDELGTDGGTNFGSMSKKRLRQLEVPGLDSDQEVPDDVIAASLLNRRVFAEVKREQREDKDGNKQFDIDEKTGLKTPLYRLRIIGYVRQPVAGAQVGQPGLPQGLPQGQPGLPQGLPQGAPQFAPQPGVPQGYPQPGAPQGWPQAPGMAPGGFAPPAPGAVPGGYAPQAAPGFPQVAPPPGWGAPNGAQPGLPAAPGMAPGMPYPGAPGAPRVG